MGGSAAPGGTKRSTKKEHKAKKDPNAPKRGLSAYMFFANEQRDQVVEQLQSVLPPGEKYRFGDVGKMLGEQWKALKPEEKAPYEAKADVDKKRYIDQKEAYDRDPEGWNAEDGAGAPKPSDYNLNMESQQLGF